jgi:hypothetical protein
MCAVGVNEGVVSGECVVNNNVVVVVLNTCAAETGGCRVQLVYALVYDRHWS